MRRSVMLVMVGLVGLLGSLVPAPAGAGESGKYLCSIWLLCKRPPEVMGGMPFVVRGDGVDPSRIQSVRWAKLNAMSECTSGRGIPAGQQGPEMCSYVPGEKGWN